MITLFAFLALASLEARPQAAPEPAAGPVVVELFTSQGCPMCPDANVLLQEIGGREDVLAIAYSVGWWDMYGWEDEFARPEFAERQQAYVDAGEAMRVFTPHFVINGAPEKMRFSEPAVRAGLEAAAPLAALVEIADGAVRIDGPLRESPAQIWRVDYRPGAIERTIGSGANAGRTMVHYNMARRLTPLGDWPGGPMTMALEPADAGLRTVVLVQDGPGGRLIGAAHRP